MTAYQQAHYRAMKKQIVKDFKGKLLSQKEAIRILQISSVGFWKLCKNYDKYGDIAITGLKRGPKPWSRPHNRTSAEHEALVAQVLVKYPYLGSRRLAQVLEDDHGIRMHRNTVLRILKRKELLPGKPQSPKKEPILYTKEAPGQEVQIDTEFPEGRSGRVAFVGIDDFSRWLTARIGSRATQAQSVKFLHHLVRTAPFSIQAVRTDNGPEFKAQFTRACQSLGIKHIRNPTYRPDKNGKVERVHRTMHEECFWRYGILHKPLPLMNYVTSQYLSYYNYQRRHTGLGMNNQSPFTKLKEYLTNLPLIQPANINLTVVQYTSCFFCQKLL